MYLPCVFSISSIIAISRPCSLLISKTPFPPFLHCPEWHIYPSLPHCLWNFHAYVNNVPPSPPRPSHAHILKIWLSPVNLLYVWIIQPARRTKEVRGKFLQPPTICWACQEHYWLGRCWLGECCSWEILALCRQRWALFSFGLLSLWSLSVRFCRSWMWWKSFLSLLTLDWQEKVFVSSWVFFIDPFLPEMVFLLLLLCLRLSCHLS